jgi:uncharacterized protein (DUF2141 family)
MIKPWYLGHCLWLSALSFFPDFDNTATLQIKIEGIKTNKGKVYLAVFCKEENFPDDKSACYREIITVPEQGFCSFSLPKLSFGKYAVAIYQDLNNNAKLDKNPFGIPQEPYGFSNNPTVKWRAPRFLESFFEFKPDHQSISIQLKSWKER